MLKLSIVAALLSAAPAFAESPTPFPADACNPGYTANGEFVDGANSILNQTGWVAQAPNIVVNAAGQRVFLSKACLDAYLAERATADVAGEGTLGAIGAVLAVAVVAGLLAGAGSTNGTN